MIIRFTPEADAELAEARQWYAHQRADLDIEFMERIDDALSRIINNPQLYPVVYRSLRRAVVRRASQIRGTNQPAAPKSAPTTGARDMKYATAPALIATDARTGQPERRPGTWLTL